MIMHEIMFYTALLFLTYSILSTFHKYLRTWWPYSATPLSQSVQLAAEPIINQSVLYVHEQPTKI